MFENLSDRLSRVMQNLRGQGRITEDNIKETLREIRMALLEADVALPVVREFVDRVKEQAVGAEVGTLFPAGDGGLREIIHSLSESDDPAPLRNFRAPPQPARPAPTPVGWRDPPRRRRGGSASPRR